MFTVTELVKLYRYSVLRGFACKLISLRGCEIPVSVKIESDVQFPHNSVGTVIHNNTEIRGG